MARPARKKAHTRRRPAPAPARRRVRSREAVRLDRLEGLQRLTAALSASLTPEEVTQLIIAEGFALVPARAVLLYWERTPGQLELVHAFGVSDQFADRFRKVGAPARLPIAEAYRTNAPVWLDSIEQIVERYPLMSDLSREEGDVAAVAMPVVALGGRGVLTLLFDAVRGFDDEEREFVLAVARQCVQAFERAHLFAAQKALAERLGALQETTAGLSAAATPAEVAAIALRALGRLGVKDGAIYYLESPDRLALAYELGHDERARAFLDDGQGSSASPVMDAFHRGETVWLDGPDAIRARYPELEPVRASRGDAAWAALPLAIEGRTVGVLAFTAPEGGHLDPAERPFATSLAQQCAQALERSRAYEAQKRLAERVSSLHSTAASLSGASSPQDLLQHAFRALSPLGATSAELHAFEPPDRVALLARQGSASGATPAPVPVDAPLPAAEVVRTGRALWLETPEEIGARYPELEPIRRWRSEGAWALVPLLAGGKTIGALLAAFPGPRRFDADERTYLRALAQPCAQALDRARLYQAAEEHQARAEERAAVLEEAFLAAPLGLAVLDGAMRYVRVNRALAAAHGISVEAHGGITPADVLPGPAAEAMEASFRRVIESGEAVLDVAVVGETALAAGKTRHWQASFYPVRAGDRITGVGLVLRETPAGT